MRSKNNKQLFLLHFAGGNVYSFQFLSPYLPANIDFHPLELPGRGKRINEDFFLTEFEAVEDLVRQITSLRNNQPYLIFGHSMGASLGLRITKRLEEFGDPPKTLIVAGNAGPGTGDDICRSKMSDDDLKNELKTLGGVSDEVLNHDELFDFFAPIMRADFVVLEEREKLTDNFKLRSPITAIMGDQEKTAGQIENWRQFTSNEFKYYYLPGNHFFIHDHPSDLFRIINDCYD
jgi:external thioesterase TEII